MTRILKLKLINRNLDYRMTEYCHLHSYINYHFWQKKDSIYKHIKQVWYAFMDVSPTTQNIVYGLISRISKGQLNQGEYHMQIIYLARYRGAGSQKPWKDPLILLQCTDFYQELHANPPTLCAVWSDIHGSVWKHINKG